MHQIKENFGASEVLDKSIILAALFGCPMLFLLLLLASLRGNVVYAHVSGDLNGFGTLWEPIAANATCWNQLTCFVSY